MRTRRSAAAFACAWLALVYATAVSQADEASILADIKAFFAAKDLDQREAITRRIESDPVYERAHVRAWLHQADLFRSLEPGRLPIRVGIDEGSTLPVTLRIPTGYDHRRPYPLLYVLHGTGGTGDGMIRYVERLLGRQIEQHVVAASTGYQQVVIHSTTPPSNEHLAVLQAVRRTVHVDSDRVYVLGYSRGGHASWTLAVLHSEQFAGVVPVAGTLILPGHAELYELFLPNIANTPVFACWGENDITSANYVTPSEDGGIAGLNRRLCVLAAQLGLPLTWFEVRGGGHGNIDPPREDVEKMLAGTREPYPRSVRHVFRTTSQGQADWLEAHAWRGSWWDQKPLTLKFRGSEDPADPDVQREAVARAIRGRLGELRGEFSGQEIRVYRKKISDLTVWIPDRLIDWDKPISLKVNGRKAFDGMLQPDLFVCLSQAARTYDFERLRWAGLRFKSGSRTKVITGRTPFPTPALPK